MHYEQLNKLTQVSYRVPQWMKDKILEVQRRNRMTTETEAVRHVVIKGLEALGVSLPPIEGDVA